MKKRSIEEKPHLKKKTRISSRSWVDRVLPGHCIGWSFNKPRLVEPPGRRGLIAMLNSFIFIYRRVITQ
jgi:hypothetical protein